MEGNQPGPGDQEVLWNGPGGYAWVAAQPLLDQMLEPIQDLLMQEVRVRRPYSVLDIGCGTGSTTLAAERICAPDGSVTGLDISKPMLAAAKARAAQVYSQAQFILGNAQVHTFEQDCFDMIISRFGVMFFGDPIGAFSNIRRAGKPGACLCFAAWRSPEENPFMTTAERAAAPLLDVPERRPDAPGQFAFANQERVATVLEQSGWTEVKIEAVDLPCAIPESELVRYISLLGPVGLALSQMEERSRADAVATIRGAFDGFVQDGQVRFTAAYWKVIAQA